MLGQFRHGIVGAMAGIDVPRGEFRCRSLQRALIRFRARTLESSCQNAVRLPEDMPELCRRALGP